MFGDMGEEAKEKARRGNPFSFSFFFFAVEEDED